MSMIKIPLKYLVIIGSLVSLFLIANLILELRGIIIKNISLLTWSQGIKIFQIILIQLPLGCLYVYLMFMYSVRVFANGVSGKGFRSEYWRIELAIFLGYPICTIFICLKLCMLCNYKRQLLPDVATRYPISNRINWFCFEGRKERYFWCTLALFFKETLANLISKFNFIKKKGILEKVSQSQITLSSLRWDTL